MEQFRNPDQLIRACLLPGRPHFPKEIAKLLDSLCALGPRNTRLLDRLLQELGHLQTHLEQLALLFLLCKLVLKGRGKHVGEQLQGHGEQELHEGDDQED